MIVLTLRTDKPDAELGLYDDGQQLAYETWQAHRELAETLHAKIRDMLQAQRMELHTLEGIAVYQGPGSFTGLRIGISVANALAMGLGVPIVAAQGERWLASGLERIISGQSDYPVVPEYGADAHITPQKK